MSDKYADAVEIGKKIADLQRQLDELKAKQPKEEKPFVRKDWPRFDPSEGLRAPMSALKPMVDLMPNQKDLKFDPNAWARNRYPVPGGFGPSPERMKVMAEETRRRERAEGAKKKAEEEPKDHRSPQTRIFDAMVDAMVGGPNDTSKLR
jgi:hypothetical protein